MLLLVPIYIFIFPDQWVNVGGVETYPLQKLTWECCKFTGNGEGQHINLS